jgi:hypothetical protein
MNAVLPVAETMLRRHGEFYPFGGYLEADGKIVHLGAADDDTDRPKSKDLIFVLRSALQELARDKKCVATALLLNVSVALPCSDHKIDAIQVCVDHLEGYSAEVFHPYQVACNDIVYGETRAQRGRQEIFV